MTSSFAVLTPVAAVYDRRQISAILAHHLHARVHTTQSLPAATHYI